MTSGTRVALLLALCALPVFADQPARSPPVQIELRLVHIFEGTETKHIFVIGDSGFTSVESLKDYLGTLPHGSEVRWAPGCDRFGNEPLLSSEKDLNEFRAFLSQKGIKLVLVPSG